VMCRAQNDLQRKVDLLAQVTAPPSAWNSDVPAALDRIVARATARDVEARYPSAADMLSDVENYLAAFRSSSRSVLRLVRSLTGGPVDQTGAGGFAAVVRASTPDGPAVTNATVAAPGVNADPTDQINRGPRPTAGRTPEPEQAHPRPPGEPPRPYQPAPSGGPRGGRVERPDDPHTSAVGRGEIAGTATHSALLRGSGSAEHSRYTRGVWQRRIGSAAIVLVALVMLGGIVAGARSLFGRVSGRSAASTTASTPGKGFVLMTFVSSPPGARIIDAGGRVLGQTPTTLPVPISAEAHKYRFEKDGFREATASEAANGDKTIEVDLRPVRRPEKPARKTPPAKHAPRGK